MDLTLWITVGAILALLVMSAFFSGSETALTAASKARMHQLEHEGDRRATVVNRLRDDKEKLIGGLLLFGALFAVNSSLHSYLIVSYAKEDGVSLDVGFYYMSNALGRLVGTLLSGWVFQVYGLQACLWVSSLFVVLAALISLWLPRHDG